MNIRNGQNGYSGFFGQYYALTPRSSANRTPARIPTRGVHRGVMPPRTHGPAGSPISLQQGGGGSLTNGGPLQM